MKDVAKKGDLAVMQEEINLLREENECLKREVQQMASRLEYVDQRSRSANIVIDGMNSKTVPEAKSEFADICSQILKTPADVVELRKFPNSKSFTVTLGSTSQAMNILAAKGKLKGTTLYVKKDYTKSEQNTKYNLRQLRKALTNADKNIKTRLGEFCIFINDYKYYWSNGKIVAMSNKEAALLSILLKTSKRVFKSNPKIKLYTVFKSIYF